MQIYRFTDNTEKLIVLIFLRYKVTHQVGYRNTEWDSDDIIYDYIVLFLDSNGFQIYKRDQHMS